MDRPIDVRDWQPTKPPEPGDEDLTSELPLLFSQLKDQTTELQRYPYDPRNWLERAKTLERLRYPELIVGDAHKASLLCRNHLSRLHADDVRLRLGYRMGFWMVEEGGEADESEHEMVEEILAQTQALAHYIEAKNLRKFPELEGTFRNRMYPWMEARHRVRDDDLIAGINEELAIASSTCGGETLCMLRRHAFGKYRVGEKDSSEMLGVFASRDIHKDGMLFFDDTRTFGCTGPGPDGDSSNLFGGTGCTDPLHPNLATDDTSQDLRWVRARTGRWASEVILRCRFLLCCVEDNVDHPLDHPLIARLTPTHRRDKAHLFSLEHDIIIPNEYLQQLGIDIFANHAYDTWVLFTIQGRGVNNSWSDPIHTVISPLFSLLNHSCEPNLTWNLEDNHTTLSIRAIQDIKAGEQLLVQYDSYMEDRPLAARRQRMRKWFDADCQCSRCLREEVEFKAKGFLQLQNATNGHAGEVDWDVEVKPVFPEDMLKARTKT